MAVRAHADNDEQRYGSGFAVEPNTHHRAWPLTRTAFSPRWRRYGRLTTAAREYAAVIFGNGPTRLLYFAASAPAVATSPSWLEAAPETPIAPIILPSTMRGMPPSSGDALRSASVRRPIPPCATKSSNTFVGRL